MDQRCLYEVASSLYMKIAGGGTSRFPCIYMYGVSCSLTTAKQMQKMKWVEHQRLKPCRYVQFFSPFIYIYVWFLVNTKTSEMSGVQRTYSFQLKIWVMASWRPSRQPEPQWIITTLPFINHKSVSTGLLLLASPSDGPFKYSQLSRPTEKRSLLLAF